MKARPVYVSGDLAFVPLTRGRVAVIDAADIALVENKNWLFDGRYAVRHDYSEDGKKRSILMHRMIARTPKGMDTDHISGDRLDNRRSNLRHAEHAENMWNIGMRKNNTSGYKGVTWCKSEQKWDAKIAKKGVRLHLGFFLTPEEAGAAYKQAATELHGKFARVG